MKKSNWNVNLYWKMLLLSWNYNLTYNTNLKKLAYYKIYVCKVLTWLQEEQMSKTLCFKIIKCTWIVAWKTFGPPLLFNSFHIPGVLVLDWIYKTKSKIFFLSFVPDLLHSKQSNSMLYLNYSIFAFLHYEW